MREHSGAGGGKNNNRNPTLRDAERALGHSGEAVEGEKMKGEGSKRVGRTCGGRSPKTSGSGSLVRASPTSAAAPSSG